MKVLRWPKSLPLSFISIDTINKLCKCCANHLKKNRKSFIISYLRFSSVIPLRFERKTHALEGRCSIQLSYGTILNCGAKVRFSVKFAKILRRKYFVNKCFYIRLDVIILMVNQLHTIK